MAARKAAKKTVTKDCRQDEARRRKAPRKPRQRSQQNQRAPGKRRRRPRTTPRLHAKGHGKPAAAAVTANIRVRMYRVGFGDFFLLTVPGKNGPAHILIDCGVHAANIGSMDECVQDMKKETGNRLALVILTHYHADHMSGFASNYDDFAEFDQSARCGSRIASIPTSPTRRSSWRSSRPSPSSCSCSSLRAHGSRRAAKRVHKVENALGVASEDGGGSNAKALKLLQSGFKNKPPVYYYQGGDDAHSAGRARRHDHRRDPRPLAARIPAASSPPATTRRSSTWRRSATTASRHDAASSRSREEVAGGRRRLSRRRPSTSSTRPDGRAASETPVRAWRISSRHAAGRARRCRRQAGRHAQQPEPRRALHLQRQEAALRRATRNGATGRTGSMARP